MGNHLKSRSARISVYVAVLMYVLACGGGRDGGVIIDPPPPPPPPPPAGNVAGTVRQATSNTAIAGAVVSIGSIRATTGADGTFTLNNVPGGSATIRCVSPGMADYTSNITVAAGTTTHDIRLSVQEVFDLLSGAFTLYVPASVTVVRGIIAVRGPDTRPFADPRRPLNLGANPPPNLESELMALGTDYRILAARENLAVLGHANIVVPGGGFDVAIFAALAEGAVAASRPSLATAPLLVHGISSGTPDVARLTAQNPSRVAGLVLRVPLDVSTQLGPESGAVPTYVIIAEFDELLDNNVTRATYQNIRGTGGLWAFAETRTQHQSHSASQRELILEWFTAVLALRESTTPGGPLRVIPEESGWLGDPATRVVSSWADYVGNKRAASWFPTQATAVRWRGFTGTQ